MSKLDFYNPSMLNYELLLTRKKCNRSLFYLKIFEQKACVNFILFNSNRIRSFKAILRISIRKNNLKHRWAPISLWLLFRLKRCLNSFQKPHILHFPFCTFWSFDWTEWGMQKIYWWDSEDKATGELHNACSVCWLIL